MRIFFRLVFLYSGLFLLFLPVSGQSLETMEVFDTPDGTRLYYAVIAKGKAYNFCVNVLSFRWNKEVSFKWETGVWGGKKTGEVVLTKRSNMLSEEILTSFEPNKKILYDNETAIWVSKKIYNALTQSWGAEIKTGGISSFFSCVEHDKFAVSLDDRPVYVPCLKAKTKDGGSIWILDNRDSPLILKLDMGFEMELMTALTGREE